MSAWFWIGWIGCGALGHGLHFAYFQREFPLLAEKDYKRDMMRSLFTSIFGPAQLVATLIFLFISTKSGFRHGLKFW